MFPSSLTKSTKRCCVTLTRSFHRIPDLVQNLVGTILCQPRTPISGIESSAGMQLHGMDSQHLAWDLRGKKAAHFKELYIRRFNEMEKFIQTLVSARQEFPLLTENIKLLHEDPKPYHFSNECNMLNRIVLGMTAKQFRLANGIEKGTSIRPYLAKDQIDMLETLQKVDVGLLVAFPSYEDRKRHLEWYKAKLEEDR